MVSVSRCPAATPPPGSRPTSPLARSPSAWGHSVETLVSTYVGALDIDEALASTRVTAALA